MTNISFYTRLSGFGEVVGGHQEQNTKQTNTQAKSHRNRNFSHSNKTAKQPPHPVRQNRSTTTFWQFREDQKNTNNKPENQKVLIICKSEHTSTTTTTKRWMEKHPKKTQQSNFCFLFWTCFLSFFSVIRRGRTAHGLANSTTSQPHTKL